MKVALAVSPLPGLRAGEACALVCGAWSEVRGADEVASRLVSDAIAMPYVGSGADDVLAGSHPRHVERGQAGERHFAYRSAGSVLLDYTHLLHGIPGEGAIRSSRLVGEDLAWAVREGITDVTVVLPVPGSVSDLGMGLLDPLSAGAQGIGAQLDATRTRLSGMSVRVLVPGEQPLLGLAGLARSWMASGLSSKEAQDLENRFSEIVSTVPGRASGLTIIGDSGGFERNVYAGCGGGIAYVLGLLGARVFPIGDVCIEPMRRDIEESDLFVYVCGRIGEDLPSGLLAGSRIAASRGVPVIVLYDSGAIRKGELAPLGLNGAYEIRPELAFSDAGATTEELAYLPRRLEGLVGRVARTWGWN